MNNFNLLISTSRNNEFNAKAEIWFTLLICGDKYSIVTGSDYPGLITAATTLNHKDAISKIKKILERDPNFFQYILKIIPIDFVCETNINTINSFIQNHYKENIHQNETFKIDLKRRKNDLIDRDILIDTIAKNIDNKVDLTNPDKIIRIEMLRNISGISFISPNEIISLRNSKIN